MIVALYIPPRANDQDYYRAVEGPGVKVRYKPDPNGPIDTTVDAVFAPDYPGVRERYVQAGIRLHEAILERTERAATESVEVSAPRREGVSDQPMDDPDPEIPPPGTIQDHLGEGSGPPVAIGD